MKKIHFYSGNNNINDLLIIIKFFLFSNFFNKTKTDKKLNSLLLKLIGSKNNYFFSSGRMGLFEILKAIGVKKNDEIIIPAYTCVVVPNAIIYCHAKPVYVDIKLSDFNIDEKLIVEKVTARTKAIYAQHTFGNPCNMKILRKIADKYNLILIEDSAHLFTKQQIKKTLADVTFFSTDRSKVLNTYLGGIVSTNNKIIKKELDKRYKTVPEVSKYIEFRIFISFILEILLLNRNFYFIGKYIHIFLSKFLIIFFFKDELLLDKPTKYDYPSKLSYGLKQILIRQLVFFNLNIIHRKKITVFLNKFFKKKNNCDVLLRFSLLTHNRQIFYKLFNFIDFDIWFTSIAEGRYKNLQKIFYKKGSCPNAEYATTRIINFPTHVKVDLNKIKLILQKNKKIIFENIIQNEENFK